MFVDLFLPLFPFMILLILGNTKTRQTMSEQGHVASAGSDATLVTRHALCRNSLENKAT